MTKASMPARKPRVLMTIWRQIIYRPRLLAAICVGLVTFAVLSVEGSFKISTMFLAAWNIAAWLYLILAWGQMYKADSKLLLQQAQRHDEGKAVILLICVLASVFSLLAILKELALSDGLTGAVKAWHVALAFVTILSSWAFIHTAFSLHYAHAYYLRPAKAPPPLAFPGTEDPLYPDFLYFAFVIGTSAQTADVSFTTSNVRRVGLIHCVVAFAFNTTVIALMINLSASLITN